MSKSGTRVAFVGLTTVDLLYGVEAIPQRNEKIVARSQAVFAGGPATNAAMTCAFLGGKTCLHSSLGKHPATSIARDELARYGVEHFDLAPEYSEPPSVSSILVLAASGERSVVSANATRLPAGVELLNQAAIAASALLMVDGHNMKACVAAAQVARAHGVTTVLDGGSWKAGMEELLPLIDYPICSQDFRLPGMSGEAEDIAGALMRLGAKGVAITRGERPVLAWEGAREFEVVVPQVRVVDTLGAGDVFHGAFCRAFAVENTGFEAALQFAVRVASASCEHEGARGWMADWRG